MRAQRDTEKGREIEREETLTFVLTHLPQGSIQIVGVCPVMCTMMHLHGPRVDHWLKGINRVGQLRQLQIVFQQRTTGHRLYSQGYNDDNDDHCDDGELLHHLE